jgi:hypothetical protein
MQLEDRTAVLNTLESKLKWNRDNFEEATEGDDHSMGAYHDDDESFSENNPELGHLPLKM